MGPQELLESAYTSPLPLGVRVSMVLFSTLLLAAVFFIFLSNYKKRFVVGFLLIVLAVASFWGSMSYLSIHHRQAVAAYSAVAESEEMVEACSVHFDDVLDGRELDFRDDSNEEYDRVMSVRLDIVDDALIPFEKNFDNHTIPHVEALTPAESYLDCTDVLKAAGEREDVVTAVESARQLVGQSK